MWEIWAEGAAPQPFTVAPLSASQAAPVAAPAAPQIARRAYEVCPLCGSGAHKPFLGADCSQDPAYRSTLAPQVLWHLCEDCDHFFTEGYFEGADIFAPLARETLGHAMEAGRQAAAPRVAAVARHIGPLNCDAAWLDVGFGNAALLFTAAEWGFEAVGLDTRPGHVAGLRQLGLEAHEGTLEDLDAPGRFGIVSLNDQLPRMVDPARALAAARRLLQPDGLLLLGLPNMDAMAFNLLHAQDANPHWGEITHYHMFGRARLYALLREQGFQPLEYQVNPQIRIGMDVIARKLG